MRRSNLRERVLVTRRGGGGGSHLCESLLADGNDVLCVDTLFFDHYPQYKLYIKVALFNLLPSDYPAQRQADITLAGQVLNSKASIDLEEGLRKAIGYFENSVPA